LLLTDLTFGTILAFVSNARVFFWGSEKWVLVKGKDQWVVFGSLISAACMKPPWLDSVFSSAFLVPITAMFYGIIRFK
jgi:hypothetical protein